MLRFRQTIVSAWLVPVLLVQCSVPLRGEEPRPPNFVLLFLDNVGYGDLGCYGNQQVLTPNMDALAAAGVRCTDFYVGSPSCMPSRAALLTGRHPLRNGLNEQLWKEPSEQQIGLAHDERLIPKYLHDLGYTSACIGKWNIGFAPGSRPTERGFDEFFGHASGNMHYYNHVYDLRHDLYRGLAHDYSTGYSTYLFADAACEFIRRSVDRPFFLYVPFNAAHFPNRRNHRPDEPVIWQAPDESFANYGWTPDEADPQRRYYAVLNALDEGVGRILKQLDEAQLSDETLVVLLSDNGAFMLPDRGLEVASNLPLRSGGVTVWEGGIRVAACARWPGRIPAGSVCSEPLVSMDILPTLLTAAGGKLPDDRVLDGYDALPTLAGQRASPHELLVFRWEEMDAVRFGDFKILRVADDAPWQLYNLRRDIAEMHDLAAEQPEIVDSLEARFLEWQTQLPH